MSKKTHKILAILLVAGLLTGCGSIPGGSQTPSMPKDLYIEQSPLTPLDVPSTTPPTTEPKETTPPETAPPETTPPETAPPETTPPETTPPETTPPETTPPETTPPETAPPETAPPTEPPVSPSEGVENEAGVLPSGNAAIPNISKPVASGTKVKSNPEATIDYSNTSDGYVMVQYTASTTQKLKVQVKGPSTTYTYNLTPQQWAVFPLSDENGNYQVVIYKNVTGTKYAAVLSLTITVQMADEFAPFIRSNQYVNFDAAPATVSAAATIAGNISDPLKKVAAIYNFVVKGMRYDTQLAATVTSGYLPDLDKVLSKMSGICFDYAALMTGMLRSQGVPTKLVIGYAGDVYHAWISVYSSSTGWVEGAVYFDGVNWQRMDPTFASSGGSAVMEYIGNGSNYSAKYIY